LLENSFASGPDFRSGAERAVLGRFQTDSEPLIGQAVTFAKGSHLPSSSSNALSACGRLAPFRCLSDILAYKHPLEAHLPGTIAQHSVKAELRVFCDFGIASKGSTALIHHAAYLFTALTSWLWCLTSRGREGLYPGLHEPLMQYVGYGVPRTRQAVEKVVVAQISADQNRSKTPKTQSKTLQNWGLKPLNGVRKRHKGSFSTR
jgi:hypothetical protein